MHTRSITPAEHAAIVCQHYNPETGRTDLFARFGEDQAAAMRRALTAARRRPPEQRSYPRFKPGMSTAEYVAEFEARNGQCMHSAGFWAPLNSQPAELYENGALDWAPVVEVLADDAAELAPVAVALPAAPTPAPVAASVQATATPAPVAASAAAAAPAEVTLSDHPAVIKAHARLDKARAAMGCDSSPGRRWAGRRAAARLDRLDSAREGLTRAFAQAERAFKAGRWPVVAAAQPPRMAEALALLTAAVAAPSSTTTTDTAAVMFDAVVSRDASPAHLLHRAAQFEARAAQWRADIAAESGPTGEAQGLADSLSLAALQLRQAAASSAGAPQTHQAAPTPTPVAASTLAPPPPFAASTRPAAPPCPAPDRLPCASLMTSGLPASTCRATRKPGRLHSTGAPLPPSAAPMALMKRCSAPRLKTTWPGSSLPGMPSTWQAAARMTRRQMTSSPKRRPRMNEGAACRTSRAGPDATTRRARAGPPATRRPATRRGFYTQPTPPPVAAIARH